VRRGALSTVLGMSDPSAQRCRRAGRVKHATWLWAAAYDRRIDGADRDSGNPIGMQIGLGQRLIDARLIGAGKKAKVIPDEYGFSINPNLASAYRDIQLELRALVNEPTRKIPAIAEKIKKLAARSDAIMAF
jgi:hypothetical protein